MLRSTGSGARGLLRLLGFISWALQLWLRGSAAPVWNLPRRGIEPLSPALVGESFTTEPPGKSLSLSFYLAPGNRGQVWVPGPLRVPPFPQHPSLRIQLNPRQREAPPACLPASPPSQNRPRLPDSLVLSFSTELSAALSCNTFSQLGTKKSKYLFFCAEAALFNRG